MKIELTQRDKKLLTFMGVFVIVALMGYYAILPQIKAANEYKEEIEEAETIQTVYQTKVGQLPLVQANNEELERLIVGSKDNYYEVMDSDEIDNLVTNTVIDKYGLISYDLVIGEKSLTSLVPYMYSNKALTGESDALNRAMNAAAPVISEDGMILFSDVSAADINSEATGIYVVPVQMRLSGEMENIYRFLDDLALNEKKLRLVDYSVETKTTLIPHEDGTEEIITEDFLNVSFEFYMCAE